MLYPEKIKILAKKNQPKPEEARYWIDLTADPYGGIWKVWNGLTWIRVFASSGSGGGIEEAPSDGNLYGRKNQVWQEIDIPDVSIYATKTELDQKADKDSVPDLSDYLTASDIAKYYQPKGDYLTEIPEGYLTITEADGRYALKDESGGEVDIDLSDYLTIANAESTYATKSEVQTVREHLQTEVDTKQDTLISGTNIKTINGTSLLGSGNITLETPEGGLSDAASDGKLYGRKDGTWSEIVMPDISGLATKSELSSKLDTSTYTSDKSTFATTAQLSSKQDTLVSGTNIKTVNGQTILGEGNVQIETPEGGIADAPSDDNTYARKNGAWTTITIPDTSNLATKAELSSYATLTGAQFTGTIGAPMVAVVDNSDGMRAAIQSSNNDILFRTYNAGIDSMTFQVQNSTPLKITEAGIWENDTLLENKYAKLTDLDDLALKAELPSNVSELTNDAGYITNSSLASYATQEYVNTQISNLINSAPEALNTLDELAAALNDDSNFATTVTNQIATKLDITTYTNDKETFALKTELSGKADSSALANYLTTATAESTYAKKSEIPQQSLLPYDFFGVIDNYSTGSYITINADSKYLSVYNVQYEIDLLDIRFTDGLYKGVEYLIVIISNNYTPDVRPLGYNNQEIQIIGDTDKFSMQANQILEISAIRTDSAVICRVSSSSDYTGNISDGTFG